MLLAKIKCLWSEIIVDPALKFDITELAAYCWLGEIFLRFLIVIIASFRHQLHHFQDIFMIGSVVG